MTVEEMCDRMSYAELLDWMALDDIREEERQKAERLAKQGMKNR